jgi:hypothetical protein
MFRNQCLLKYWRRSCGFRSRYFMLFPFISTKLSALRLTDVDVLSKIHNFTQISWKAFSTHCYLISLSHWSVPNTPKSSGVSTAGNPEFKVRDRAGQLTGLPHPIHSSPKLWFSYCLTERRKWAGAPSCMKHMRCPSWRGTCSKVTDKALTKNDGTLHLFVC